MNISAIMAENASTIPKHKRSRPDSDSEPDSEPSQQSTTVFPRFLIIESLQEDKPLSKLSPFVIEKSIQSMAGTAKSVKKLRNGSLLIEVEKKSHSQNLLKLKTFFQIPSKCTPHSSLNSCRGVIRHPELAYVTEEELIKELKSQHVTAARRISNMKGDKRIQTNTFILRSCLER